MVHLYLHLETRKELKEFSKGGPLNTRTIQIDF